MPGGITQGGEGSSTAAVSYNLETYRKGFDTGVVGIRSFGNESPDRAGILADIDILNLHLTTERNGIKVDANSDNLAIAAKGELTIDDSDNLAIDILGGYIVSEDPDICQKATDTLLKIYLSLETDQITKEKIEESAYGILGRINRIEKNTNGSGHTNSSDLKEETLPAASLIFLAIRFAERNGYDGEITPLKEIFNRRIVKEGAVGSADGLGQNDYFNRGRPTTYLEVETFCQGLKMGEGGVTIESSLVIIGGDDTDPLREVKRRSEALTSGQIAIIPVFTGNSQDGHWTAIVLEKRRQEDICDVYYFDSRFQGEDISQHSVNNNIVKRVQVLQESQPLDENTVWHLKGFNLQESNQYSSDSPANNSCGVFVCLLAQNIVQAASGSNSDQNQNCADGVIEALAVTPKPDLEENLASIRRLMILGALAKNFA